MNRLHPILAIAVARLREFVRRPESVFWVYFFPVLMVVVLGVAFRNRPPETFDVDVLSGPLAATIINHLEPHPQIKPRIVDAEESRDRLRTSKTTMLIRSDSDSLDSVEYLYDPMRPGSLAARNLVDHTLQLALGRRDVIESADRVFSEPGGQYVDYLVPGLLAMGLMGGGLWGVGFAIVDMRMRKLLKRLMATPMKRSHFLMGMMTSRLVFMVPQIVVLLLFSYLIFGVRIHGNWASIMLVVLIGAIEFAGIGLLIGSRAQTLESVSGLMNLVMLPMWTLSGIFFSYERFPVVVQPLIKCLPLTPVIDALRAMMMDGRSLLTLGPELAIMVVWCIVPFCLAMLIFRWND